MAKLMNICKSRIIIIFAILALFFVAGRVLYIVGKNAELENGYADKLYTGPYYEQTPLHEAELNYYYETYSGDTSFTAWLYRNTMLLNFALPSQYIVLPVTISYYERPGDKTPVMEVEKGTGVILYGEGLGSFYREYDGNGEGYGIYGYPTYERGWRYVKPFILKDEYKSYSSYVYKDLPYYYVKLSDIEAVCETIYDENVHIRLAAAYSGLSRQEYVHELPLRVDRALYNCGYYYSPDLAYTLFDSLNIFLLSAAGAALVLNMAGLIYCRNSGMRVKKRGTLISAASARACLLMATIPLIVLSYRVYNTVSENRAITKRFEKDYYSYSAKSPYAQGLPVDEMDLSSLIGLERSAVGEWIKITLTKDVGYYTKPDAGAGDVLKIKKGTEVFAFAEGPSGNIHQIHQISGFPTYKRGWHYVAPLIRVGTGGIYECGDMPEWITVPQEEMYYMKSSDLYSAALDIYDQNPNVGKGYISTNQFRGGMSYYWHGGVSRERFADTSVLMYDYRFERSANYLSPNLLLPLVNATNIALLTAGGVLLIAHIGARVYTSKRRGADISENSGTR